VSGGFLLDSHVFVWLADGTRSLPRRAVDTLQTTAETLFVSAVSVAELCIKSALGKFALPPDVIDDPAAGFTEIFQRMNLELLPLELSHAVAIAGLIPHHKDPFDRLLLVTHDRAFASYDGLRVLWV
jgi:PIN domain nuclease of toxin-antitoxin system